VTEQGPDRTAVRPLPSSTDPSHPLAIELAFE